MTPDSDTPANVVQVALADSTVALSAVTWRPDIAGIMVRELEIDGRRWALVEYGAGAQREEWCEDGHLIVVLSGQIEYEFEDGGEAATAIAGDALTLSTGRGHRGRNRGDTATTLFIIDDPA
jgi:quercetin dioxygenase-like cupin family protein